MLIGGRPSKLFMQPKLIDHFLRRGMCCWLLGVNEDCDIDVIPRLHATGALTDKPEWMKFELNKPENKRKVRLGRSAAMTVQYYSAIINNLLLVAPLTFQVSTVTDNRI